MVLLELLLQGVRGFSPSTRLSLKPGYWVLVPPAATGAPLAPLLTALLYPEGRGEDAAFAAEKGAKAALTFQGRDQGVYRIVRELGRSGGLEHYDAAGKAFRPVTQDAQELTQFLRGQAGVPTRASFASLMCLTPAQLPSRRPKKAAVAEPGKGASKTALAVSRPVEAAADVGAARAKLAQLERELALSAEIEQLQYRLDGLASELDSLDGVTRRTQGLREELGQLEGEWAAAPSPESLGLPQDIVVRCQRAAATVARRDEAFAKLEAEKEREATELTTSSGRWVPPLYRDRRFVVGALLGTVFLVAGGFLDGMGRYVALLDVPAFGLAALAALRHVDQLEAATRGSRRGGRLAAREAKLRADFEAELAPVVEAQKTLGVDSPDEVVALLGRKAELAEQVEAMRRRIEATEADPEIASAAERQVALRAEHDQLSEALRDKAGGFVRDAREVEREISRLKESISLAESPGASAPATTTTPAASAAGTAGPGFEDFGPALLSAAADLYSVDVPTAFAQLKDRAAQYVAAFTDKRLTAFDADREGRLAVNAGGKRTPIGELPAKELDLAFVALRLTVAERYGQKVRVPFLLEEGLPLDEAKLPLLGKMLKHLGTLAQVLHVTPRTAMGSLADGVLKL